MRSADAFAKINLALVVGPLRPDGKHEVVTVLQRVDISDVVQLAPTDDTAIVVEGFDDTIVRHALEAFAEASGAAKGWHVRLEKRIPIAAGLGGGSSDAAAALRLANDLADQPLGPEGLRAVAKQIGSDVPFFLERGTQLATGDGSDLVSLALPLDLWVVLALPDDDRKESTASVYQRFDEQHGADGFETRRSALLDILERVTASADLTALPRNDLASSPLAGELERLGALRADVTGAGPAVYGLFDRREDAERAAHALRTSGWTRVVRPVAGP